MAAFPPEGAESRCVYLCLDPLQLLAHAALLARYTVCGVVSPSTWFLAGTWCRHPLAAPCVPRGFTDVVWAPPEEVAASATDLALHLRTERMLVELRALHPSVSLVRSGLVSDLLRGASRDAAARALAAPHWNDDGVQPPPYQLVRVEEALGAHGVVERRGFVAAAQELLARAGADLGAEHGDLAGLFAVEAVGVAALDDVDGACVELLQRAEKAEAASFTVTYGHVAAKAAAPGDARVVFHFLRPSSEPTAPLPTGWRLRCPPVRPAWTRRDEIPSDIQDEVSKELPMHAIAEDGWTFDGSLFYNIDGRKQRLHPLLGEGLDARLAQDAARMQRELAAREQLVLRGAE